MDAAKRARFSLATSAQALVPDHIVPDSAEELTRPAKPRLVRPVVAVTRAFLDTLHEHRWRRKTPASHQSRLTRPRSAPSPCSEVSPAGYVFFASELRRRAWSNSSSCQVGNAITGRGEGRHGDADDVGSDAGPAGVATDGGHRSILAVLPGSLRHSAGPNRLHRKSLDAALPHVEASPTGGFSGGPRRPEAIGGPAVSGAVRSNVELARSLGSTGVGDDWHVRDDWHVHDEGSGTPSPGDEQAWTGLRDHADGLA